MDVAAQDWLTAIAFGIVAGGIIGWVHGHKMRDKSLQLLTTPLSLQKGSTGKVLVLISLGLVALSFTIGIWHGVLAIVLCYITNLIVGSRVMHDSTASLGKAIKTTITVLLLVSLPYGGYQYYQYNRAPNDQDRLAFIYECDEHLANDVFKGENRSRATAQATCTCLWPDLVGRYHTIGKINEKARYNNGELSIAANDINAMALTCMKDFHNRD